MNDKGYSAHEIHDAKSIDGKKGRFIRMRSPVGGKLLKHNQEPVEKKKMEITSPSSRDMKEGNCH